MKFGQSQEKHFPVKIMQKMRQGGYSRPLFAFEKSFYEWKAIGLPLGFNRFWFIVNFDFLEKILGLVSPPHFAYDFSRNIFSCYILLTDHISLSDCLYFLKYRAICVLQLFLSQVDRDVINFEFNLSNQAVFIHDQNKSQDKNLNILRMKKAYKLK